MAASDSMHDLEEQQPDRPDGGKIKDSNEPSSGRQERQMLDLDIKMEDDDDSDIQLPEKKTNGISGEEQKELEDMLDDDNDDAEFSSHRKVEKQEIPPSSPPIQNLYITAASTTAYTDPEVMYAFYSRLFPFRPLYQWLNHGIKPATDFMNREFALTLANDVYLRYQSFQTADLLRKEILRQNPKRFEIGPEYSTNPRDRKSLRKPGAFRAVNKELVFDIDLTDYDEIRTCCDKTKICNKCWSFIIMAMKVMDAALREDFGFKHIMWVYSGRRGAHCWVSDKRAREMDDTRRKALAGYFELIRGGAQSGKKVNIKRPLHPHIQRSLDILKDHFSSDILIDQNPFLTVEQSNRLLELLPDKKLCAALKHEWESAPNRPSASKWSDIDTLAKTAVSSKLDSKALLEAKQDIVLEYTYPRLDAEVSKKLIHLLKSPFVIHPGTGRVCVPIDVRRAEEFDPLGVPTVTELLNEIDAWNSKHSDNDPDRKMQDYEKTSLKPYVDYFKEFIAELLRDERPIKRERKEGSMEF